MAAISSAASVFTGKALVQAKTAPKAKASVAVTASADARKAASLLAAGVIALQATPAMALNMIELQDERQTNKNGLQLIYEARDLNITQSVRQDGNSRFSFQKLTTAQTATRASESIKRLNNDVGEYVGKAYWTQAANELRRQVGTLRFDMNNLVADKGGDKAAAKAFYASIEKLDFSIRQKDQAAATAALAAVQDQGNALIKQLA